jgi:hypothetical protein
MTQEKKKVAILFFGLTRTLKDVYPSLKQNLFNVLIENNFEYDNFVHTYTLPNPFQDPITQKITYNYDNESYKILNPRDCILEEQMSVAKNLQIGRHFTKDVGWGGYAQICANQWNCTEFAAGCALIRNMVLAVYSKKRVTELFSKYKDDYDYVIITRPDQAINNKFNVGAFSLLNDGNIIVPREHSYKGINDRICIARPRNAILYGFAFNFLLEYSKIKALCSEEYWKWYITEVCKLNIIYGSLLATLIR